MEREALKLALEVNESMKDVLKQVNELIAENKALKEALAQPEQEPVAWYHDDFGTLELSRIQRVGWKPLYAAPPQRTWVGLTNDEVNNFAAGCHLGKSVQGAIYEAEAKLKEKNNAA